MAKGYTKLEGIDDIKFCLETIIPDLIAKRGAGTVKYNIAEIAPTITDDALRRLTKIFRDAGYTSSRLGTIITFNNVI